jgi:ABC-2 type transport system permease protein
MSRSPRQPVITTVLTVNDRALANPWLGFYWLSRRECHRVLRLWRQTTLAPVVSSLLFIVVFGLSLGGRIKQIDGFDYDQFIVPGLIAMAMAQAVYSNNASTIYQGRADRFISDVLAAPIRNWQVNAGYLIGGAFRALVIGGGLAACAIPITGAPVVHPFLLVLAVLLLVGGFGALGTIVGIYAESFDHTSFVNNIVILPLTFLGGVFYSVTRLGSPWEQLSHINPLFYVVETIRYGFLGVSDVSPWIAFAVCAGMCVALLAWSQWLFTSGRKLKP